MIFTTRDSQVSIQPLQHLSDQAGHEERLPQTPLCSRAGLHCSGAPTWPQESWEAIIEINGLLADQV